MAELIWQGKQTTPPISHIPAYLLHTSESFDGHPLTTTTSSTDTWENRLILGDTTHVLPTLLAEFAECVNLIYIDPPFMTGRDFMSGTQLAYSDKWDNNLDIYLQWLYETCFCLRQLLAYDGSLYIHLDWHVVHYVKVLLDEVFGCSPNARGPGFKNEIVWHYQSGGRSQRRYARKHDTLLLYSKSAQYCFHGERIGERRGANKRNHMRKQVEENGHITWTIHSAGKLYSYDEDQPMTPSDVWSDISHLHQKDPERNGYVTQKPAALLERVILASSEPGDLVLDCFCGSGVSPAVAEQLGRRWIACDRSELAITLTRQRLLQREPRQSFVVQQLIENATQAHTAQHVYDIIGMAQNETHQDTRNGERC